MRGLVLGASPGNIGQAIFDELFVRPGMEKVERYDENSLNVLGEADLDNVVRSLKPTHVVYSVGINKLDWIKDIDTIDFVRMMRVNVVGFVNLIQALWYHSKDARSVVAISSDAARRPMRTSLAYCASKAALDMAVRVASRELAPSGWRINAVSPGKVANTPMTRYVDSRVSKIRGWSTESVAAYERLSTPIDRTVTKQEVVEVVMSVLFGPAALTGEIIQVNGGR